MNPAFDNAIAVFRDKLPGIIDNIKQIIATQSNNSTYLALRHNLLGFCHQNLNPDINAEEVDEVIVQHLITKDILAHVFKGKYYEQGENLSTLVENVSRSLILPQQLSDRIENLSWSLILAAGRLENYEDQQKLLKTVYENFYQAYDPAQADKLGVVYTPQEIVKFMVESTDYLLQKHFGTALGDKNVEIIDPAVGTGTFLTEILQYLSPEDVMSKYDNQLYGNEVSFLPYYIAKLNIEHVYTQKTGKHKEFENLRLVDTLETITLYDEGKQQQLNIFD